MPSYSKRSEYDPAVCILDYTDGNWLFVMPGSACSGTQCGWNLISAPYVSQPPSSNYTYAYTCDNTLQSLPWLDYERPNKESVVPEAVDGPNRYACKCGGPLTMEGQRVDAHQCGDRCQTPWQAEFGKQCNIVTSTAKRRGNYPGAGFANTVGAMQGACLPVAASYVFPGTTFKSYIDEIGITTNCTGEVTDQGDQQVICSCDGALPATPFGRTLANRDPCGLERSGSKAWIAGPVVGGVAALAAVAVAAALVLPRRRRQRSGKVGDDIALTDFAVPITTARRLTVRRSLTVAQRQETAADGAAQTTSQVDSVDASSTDSGIGILGAAAQPAKV